MEFEIVLEHAEQVLLQAHHERVNPGVEEHIGALVAHLWGVAGWEILDVHGGGDDCAGHAEPLGNVPLHLRAEHQVGCECGDGGLHLEVVVGDEGLQAMGCGCGANLAGQFT